MLEIELKVRVPYLEKVRGCLFAKNATFEGEIRERDVYFNAPHRDFARTDEALRLRYHGNSVTLTYKGPKLKEYQFKARTELNTKVDLGDVMEDILGSMGFVRVAEVRKDREYFHYKGALVSLDRVEGLGSFVEIEVAGNEGEPDPHKKIERLAEELGVEGKPLLESYLELLLSKR
ncbi:MAG TPA: class IV adenylate cyclase [Methanoregulaceae archaeon]|nr:class IV adenylate cyclase [Methanoregulaceae archaeon]